jgi:hypothetical protein
VARDITVLREHKWCILYCRPLCGVIVLQCVIHSGMILSEFETGGILIGGERGERTPVTIVMVNHHWSSI